VNNKCSAVVLNNIKLPVNASYKEAFSVAEKRLRRIGFNPGELNYSIYRRSVDARKKDDIRFVYSVIASGELPEFSDSQLANADAVKYSSAEPDIRIGSSELRSPVVIVGSGPAGMFAALILAENGYAPIILERGGSVSERIDAIARFKATHILDTETNIQYGAGGAGTFSDGKLVTRINDPLTAYVLRRFVEFGASEKIKYIVPVLLVRLKKILHSAM